MPSREVRFPPKSSFWVNILNIFSQEKETNMVRISQEKSGFGHLIIAWLPCIITSPNLTLPNPTQPNLN